MKSSIELLEPRRLFSAITQDYVSLVDAERTLPAIFSSAAHQESRVTAALHSDLSREKLFRANYPALVALARDEAADIRTMRRDVRVFELSVNADARVLLIRGFDGQELSTSSALQLSFSSSLARFEQTEDADQQKLLNDSVSASTGMAASELAVIAAADPSDVTLQSDEQIGTANLANLATTLGDTFSNIDTNSASLVSDSSNIAIYGSENLFGQDFPAKANPYQGSVLSGLTADASTVAISKFVAPAAFTPSTGDYPGTDQIYVGSDQVPGAGQLAGPQVITLDYSALTKLSHPIKTFTLGIATDGFENPTINIPYTVSINGVVNPALTSILNNLNDADRVEQYVSIGIDPAQLLASKVLTISIDSPGNDVSGWAVDFLTVGIQNG